MGLFWEFGSHTWLPPHTKPSFPKWPLGPYPQHKDLHHYIQCNCRSDYLVQFFLWCFRVVSKKNMPTLVGISKNRMLPQMAVLLFKCLGVLFVSFLGKQEIFLLQVVMPGKGLPYTFLASICRRTYRSRVSKPQHIPLKKAYKSTGGKPQNQVKSPKTLLLPF
jgi:hypothetical protein